MNEPYDVELSPTGPLWNPLPIRRPFRPELRKDVIAYLATHLLGANDGSGPSASVVEIGSGYSTLWFAPRVARITSLEHDPEWYAAVGVALDALAPDERGPMSPSRHLIPAERHATVLLQAPEAAFDLVYVDGVEAYRADVARAALSKVAPGGLLVLDDTHWESLRLIVAALDADPRWTLVLASAGPHVRIDGEEKFHSTHVYRREDDR